MAGAELAHRTLSPGSKYNHGVTFSKTPPAEFASAIAGPKPKIVIVAVSTGLLIANFLRFAGSTSIFSAV